MHIAIFFAAAISSGGLDGFTVDDVKIGLLDTRTKAVMPHTESVKYRTNGKCIVAGNQRDCMWWGLSFDYRGLTVGEDVLCSIQTSQGVHKSDIYHQEADKTKEMSTRLHLKPTRGKYVGQYYMEREPSDAGMMETVLTCRYREAVIFTKKFVVDLAQ